MPEERSSPSAGWRAVYAAMGAAAAAEGATVRERAGDGRRARDAATDPSSGSSARRVGAVVRPDDRGAHADPEVDDDRDADDAGVGGGAATGAETGERRRGRADPAPPPRGEAP